MQVAGLLVDDLAGAVRGGEDREVVVKGELLDPFRADVVGEQVELTVAIRKKKDLSILTKLRETIAGGMGGMEGMGTG